MYVFLIPFKVTRDGAWPQIAQQLGLPPTLPDGTPTSNQLQSLCGIFADLEIFLIRLMQSQATQARRQQQNAANPQAPQIAVDGEASQPTGGTPAASALTPTPIASGSGGGADTPAPGSVSDDSDSRKRKAEDDEEEAKRAKFRKIEEVYSTLKWLMIFCS